MTICAKDRAHRKCNDQEHVIRALHRRRLGAVHRQLQQPLLRAACHTAVATPTARLSMRPVECVVTGRLHLISSLGTVQSASSRCTSRRDASRPKLVMRTGQCTFTEARGGPLFWCPGCSCRKCQFGCTAPARANDGSLFARHCHNNLQAENPPTTNHTRWCLVD